MISSTANGSGPGPALKLETRLAGVSSDVTGITMDPPQGISGAICDRRRTGAPIDAFRLADTRPECRRVLRRLCRLWLLGGVVFSAKTVRSLAEFAESGRLGVIHSVPDRL